MSKGFQGAAEALICAAQRRARFAVARNRSERLALEYWRRQGVLTLVAPGVYARRDDPMLNNPRTRAVFTVRALAARYPDWTFSRFTAAALYGMQVPYRLLHPLHVVRAPGQNRSVLRGGAVICHLSNFDRTRRIDGVRVTDPYETVLDCLCSTGLPAGLAIADSAARDGLITVDGLRRYVKAVGRGRHGIAAARRAVCYVDPKSENGGESHARGVMIELGFKVPDLQVEVSDPMNCGAVFRVDYYWEDCRGRPIIGELDGAAKTTFDAKGNRLSVEETQGLLRKERLRESRLTLSGARVVRFSFADVCDAPRFARLLDAAGVPRVEGAAHRGDCSSL